MNKATEVNPEKNTKFTYVGKTSLERGENASCHQQGRSDVYVTLTGCFSIKKYNIFIPILTNMDSSQFCVYIMTNEENSLLYTGCTGNLKKRVAAHRSGNGGVTTRRHNLVKLVYYETVEDADTAKRREKQIKRSSKQKRLSLIESMNPAWVDLFNRL